MYTTPGRLLEQLTVVETNPPSFDSQRMRNMVKFTETPMNMLTMVVRLCEPKKNNTLSIKAKKSSV
ncbi:hypothetical protein ccbrp13_34400 [Ktedonobacteria bacterium brp13]|nr:hypothetical protein ccbrp13_34400 [Ktedonobacteria bacterium brp13]